MNIQKISLVIPCYNQSAVIYPSLQKIQAYLDQQRFAYEIIAVNDGSEDDTLKYLKQAQEDFGITVISYRDNRGKGAAIREGVARATGSVVGFLDADLAIPIEELDKFLESLARGKDITIASRFLSDSTVRIPVLFYRRILEKVFQMLRSIVLGNPAVRDTQCGFKFFTYEFAEKIFPKSKINRFAFDAELIFLAQKFGFSVEEIPIALQNPSKTSLRILRDSFSMAWDLLRVRLWEWRRAYNDLTIQVTFDDFGISQKANERILELLQRGLGDRVSVMTQGILTDEDTRALQSFPIALDLHLDRQDTIDEHRVLYGDFSQRLQSFIREYFIQPQDRNIESIWKTQIEKFRALFGALPDSLNSHEHVHFFPPYFRVAARLKKKYGIAALRSGKTRPLFQKVAFILAILGFWDRLLWGVPTHAQAKYVVSWDWIEHKKNALAYCAHWARRGKLEIIFHPERDREFAFLSRSQEVILLRKK